MVRRCLSPAIAIFCLVALPASSQLSGSTDFGLPLNISANVTINGANNDTIDFGFFIPKGIIEGIIWNDTPKDDANKEGNGILEYGEEGLKGINVSVHNVETDKSVCISSSNDTGRYTFEVPYGRYRVVVGEGQYSGGEIYGKTCIKYNGFWWWPTTDYVYLVVIDKDNPRNTTINFGLQVIE